ncbi:hypothetical protein K439DRAFT_1661620 [Ramaria rubella]|nr:hypothetical protein K439DRAFT_1661620 [Ramaria rubella]
MLTEPTAEPIRLRLRIPARPKPSAVLNISSSETEAESALQVLRPEPAVPLAIPKGAKKKRKKRKAPPAEVDSDGVLESDGVAQSAPRDKRRWGSSTTSDELGGMKPGRMSAECVIQVEQPPVRVAKGKGTHKLVKQDPLRFGPIDILTTTEWEGFLDLIAEACETTRGCLNTASLTWRWSKPANSPIMPLSTEVAFLSLRKKIGPKQPTVIVGMKPPCMPENVRAPWAGGGTDNRGNDTSAWTSLIQPPPGLEDEGENQNRNSKPKLDHELEDIVSVLEAKYPVGGCPDHPDKRCFHHRLTDLHFDLVRVRLLVWASQIAANALPKRGSKPQAASVSSPTSRGGSDPFMSSPSREGRHTRQMAPQAHPKDFPSPYAAMYYPPPPHPFANAYFSPQVYQPPLWPPHAYPAIPTHTTAPGGSHMSSPPPGGQTTREKLELWVSRLAYH